MLFQVILLVLLIISAVGFFGKPVFRYVYLARQIKGPSLWDVVTLHATHFLSDDLLHHVCELSAKYEYKPWKVWKGTRLLVLVSDPDTVGEVFKSKHLMNKYEGIYTTAGEFLGRGSLVTNGLEWKRHRNVTTPAFHKDLVEAQLDIINEEAIQLVENLRNTSHNCEFKIMGVIGERATETAIRSLIARDFNMENVPYKKWFWAVIRGTEIVQTKIMNPIYYYVVHRLQKKNRDDEAEIRNSIEECKRTVLNEKGRFARRSSETGNTPPSILDTLVAANSRSKSDCLTEKEFLDEAVTLFVTAMDSTTTAVFANLLMLALNPDVQRTLVKEIESVFDSTDNRHVNSEDLNQLEYLDMVIKETMRLFPAAPLLFRSVGEESDLNGTIVPKGSVVAVNVMSLQRNPQVYQDPLKFDPERFSINVVQNRHPYAYIPFSSGARKCVGKRHGIMVVKTFLCTLLRNYRILPGDTLMSIDYIKATIQVGLRLSGTSVKLIPVLT